MKRFFIMLLASALVLSALSLAGCAGNEETPGEEETTAEDLRTPAEIAGNVLYVSADGSDAEGDGTESKPFATLCAARDAVRNIKKNGGLPEGGITVLVGGGVYRITEAITFTSEDSGEAGKTVTYKAKPGESVIIDGGVTLDPALFVPAGEDFKSRLGTEDAKNKVMEIDLAAAGCYDTEFLDGYGYGGMTIYKIGQELFADGKRQTVARWPNGEYAVSKCLGSRDTVLGGIPMTEYKVEVPAGKAALWEGETIWFCGLIYNGWDTVTVAPFSNTVNLEDDCFVTHINQGFFYPFADGRPFYVFNIPEEMDEPGEYFIDTEAKKLYYYPDGDIKEHTLYFSQVPDYLIHGTDINYMTFDGLTFRHGRGSGITADLSEGNTMPNTHLTVKNCTFTCLGGAALCLEGAVNATVDRNEVYETGCAGIEVMSGSLSNREPARNYITNNLIHDWAQIFPTANFGINVSGVGYYIGHNELYSSTHTAINFACGDSVVEYNICRDLCHMSGDAGAIYNGGSWAKCGNVIRYNYISDVIYEYSDLHPNGIYLDDQICGQLCYGNVISNISGTGIAVSGGKNMTVKNNILKNIAQCPIGLNDNGISFQEEPAQYNGSFTGYWEPIADMDYKAEFISAMYPELSLIAEVGYLSSDADDPGTPSYEVAENNVVFGLDEPLELISEEDIFVEPYKRFSLDGVVYGGGLNYLRGVVRNNLIYDTDPGFEKVGKVEDALGEDSQVYRDLYGFERIPFEKIGIEDRKGR